MVSSRFVWSRFNYFHVHYLVLLLATCFGPVEPPDGALWPMSGELAKNKITDGRVQSHDPRTGHAQFVQLTQLEI